MAALHRVPEASASFIWREDTDQGEVDQAEADAVRWGVRCEFQPSSGEAPPAVRNTVATARAPGDHVDGGCDAIVCCGVLRCPGVDYALA